MAYCSHCGVKLDGNSKFCKECGAPVLVQDAPKQETAGDGQLFSETTGEREVPPIAAQVSSASPSPVKKQFGMKKFFIFAGSGLVGILLISLIITIVSVAGSDRQFTWKDMFHHEGSYDYYNYDYNYDDGYDYDYDYDYDASGSGDSVNTYFGNFFYADIPYSWEGHYQYEETADAVTFYSTENAAAGYGGVLFSVCRYAAGSDYQSLPSYQVLSETDSYTYIVIYPTDVQYNYNDTTLSSLYQEMAADAETTLLTSISFY